MYVNEGGEAAARQRRDQGWREQLDTFLSQPAGLYLLVKDELQGHFLRAEWRAAAQTYTLWVRYDSLHDAHVTRNTPRPLECVAYCTGH